MKKATIYIMSLFCALSSARCEEESAAHPEKLTRMEEVTTMPTGRFFRVDRTDGKISFGDKESIFSSCAKPSELTFDVSNLRALGSMGELGQLKALTIYRDSYRHCANPNRGFPGVWMAKDLSSYGPYFFTIDLMGKDGAKESIALNEKLPLDYSITLLDNIFPMAEIKDPKSRFKIRLLAFAPVSADGKQRPAGLVYHLWIENTGAEPLAGTLRLPKLFEGRPDGKWAWKEPYEFELGYANGDKLDSATTKDGRPFSLNQGEVLSIPLVLYMPGTPALEEIQNRGELAWFKDTWHSHRALLGRLQIKDQPWVAEFYERQILQALGSLAMGPTGKLAGSNWGTYPATRQTWAKDTFYSALPILSIDPALAPPILDWFHENGIRHPGAIVEGGLNHSISLSISSLMLAGKYYEHTGDKEFFRARPDLRKEWEKRLEALEASRKFPDIHLYPTRYISDGPLEGDFHCGSNIAVWHALKSFSRLLAEVYDDPAAAQHYANRADRVKADILKYTVISGKFGPQFIEGINRDGTVPHMASDGEESETALIPYYRFLPNDEPTYANYMRFSMSPENKQYTPQTRSINWGTQVPSTAPGYNKGLCATADANEIFGNQGYHTQIRRVTDADGSVWWWPVSLKKEGANIEAGKADEKNPSGTNGQIEPQRNPGKAGWFSGVYAAILRTRFVGIDYDAPTRVLTWQPLPALGDFEWQEVPFGNERFSVKLATTGGTRTATVTNPNDKPITVRLRLPAAAGEKLTIAGQPIATQPITYFDQSGIATEFFVPGNATIEVLQTFR
ncbi:MAG: hypothetical protein WCG66_08145 [bacterium]